MFTDARLTAYPVGGRSALLIFRRGAATETAHLPGGTIPPHDGAGPIHCAFAIAAERAARLGEAPRRARRRRRGSHGVALVGSISIYFRDPDGHLLELATPGLWPRLNDEHGAAG